MCINNLIISYQYKSRNVHISQLRQTKTTYTTRSFQTLLINSRTCNQFSAASCISAELYIFIACLPNKHHYLLFFQQINYRFQRNWHFPGIFFSLRVWLDRDSPATFNTEVSLPLFVIKPPGFLLTHVFIPLYLFYSSTVRNSDRPVSNELIINYSLLLRVREKKNTRGARISIPRTRRLKMIGSERRAPGKLLGAPRRVTPMELIGAESDRSSYPPVQTATLSGLQIWKKRTPITDRVWFMRKREF